MPDRISAISLKLRIIAMAIVILSILAVLGCGNRGPLYLRDAESEQAQTGQELKQKTDEADKKKKSAATADK